MFLDLQVSLYQRDDELVLFINLFHFLSLIGNFYMREFFGEVFINAFAYETAQ